MLGGMLAGTDQGGGEVITEFYETDELEYELGSHLDNRKRKVKQKDMIEFYGMSSTAAQEKHGGRKDYRASEGRVVRVEYKGDVGPIVGDILGGIRSTCTYVGARSLKELSKRTTFIRVNNQYNSVYESKTIGS